MREHLTKVVRDLKREYFGNSLKIGGYYIYKHRPIRVTHGQFIDPEFQTLSNHWTWREVLPGGELGKEGEGYGGDDRVFKCITKHQAIVLARYLRHPKEVFVQIFPRCAGFDYTPQECYKFTRHIERWEHRYSKVHPVKAQLTGEVGSISGVRFITIEGDHEQEGS